MLRDTFLGLGPMSVEVINSIDAFSKKHKKKIMLICSRNQIESEKLGRGYVNNFSTKDFSKYVKRKKNNLLIMSRDHCGPFKRDNDKRNLKKEVDNCKVSLKDDIKNDFQILHIDTSECGNAKYEVASELIDYCNLPFENECLEFYKSSRPVKTPSAEQVRQPIYKSGLNYWKNYEKHLVPLKKIIDEIN